MHNPAHVLKNNTQKLQWEFDVQTDCLISIRGLDLKIINEKKRIFKFFDFAFLSDH